MREKVEKLRDFFDREKILGLDAGLFLELYAKLRDAERALLFTLNHSKEAEDSDSEEFCNAMTTARGVLEKYLPFGLVEMVEDWELDKKTMEFDGYALDQTRRELQGDVRRLLDDNIKLKERIRELTK